MWGQLDAAYHPTVDFAQEQHQGYDLAQNVQSRRAKALIAGNARAAPHPAGMPCLDPIARPQANFRSQVRQQYPNLSINSDFEAAMQRINWE